MINSRFEVVVGSMYSGKSEELIRRLSREIIARKKVKLYKPEIDQRYHNDYVISHSGYKLESENLSVSLPKISKTEIDSYDVFGIDEVQFFSDKIILFIDILLRANKKVIVSGLLGDAWMKPFGHIPELMCLADDITHLKAVCHTCGSEAPFTKKICGTDEFIIEVGGLDSYEARCRKCYYEN